jgi:hypothetical protein
MLFSDPGNSEIRKSGIWNQDTLCNWEIRNSSHVLQNTAQQVIWEFGKSGHFRTFFSEMSQICKKVQKNAKKNAKKKKVSRKHLKFWVFIDCGDLSKHWKSVENDTEIPVHTCAFFSRNSRGAFWGFSTFNLESEVRLFDVLEKFSLLRFTGGGRRPHFYMGRKSELRFFSKSAEHVFGFGSDLCCFRENPSGRKWRRLQITL